MISQMFASLKGKFSSFYGSWTISDKNISILKSKTDGCLITFECIILGELASGNSFCFVMNLPTIIAAFIGEKMRACDVGRTFLC